GGGPAPTEGRPQTGDGGGVSYAGLVLDLDGAQGRVQLLHEVVLLVVEGRSSEAGEAQGALERQLLLLVHLLPRGLPGGEDTVGEHVHGLVEGQLFPLGPEGSPVADPVLAAGVADQLLARCPLGAEAAA